VWVRGARERRLAPQQAEHPFGARLGELVLVRRAADPAHRRVEPPEIEKEGRERTGGDECRLAGGRRDDRAPADEQDDDEHDAGEQAERRKEAPADPERPHLLVVVLGALCGDPVALELVPVERLHDRDTAEVVLQPTVQPRHGLADRPVPRLDPPQEEGAREADERHRRQRNKRERRRVVPQHGCDTADGGDDPDELPELRVEKALQPVDVAVQNRHQLAGLVVGEEAHREVLDVVVRVVTEVALNLLCRRLEEVPRAEPRRRPEQVRERGDDDEPAQEREPCRLAGDRCRRDEAEGREQPRLCRPEHHPVDRRRDDDGRDQPGGARSDRGEDAHREPRPVRPGVAEEVHHRVAVDRLTDALEAAVVAHAGVTARRPRQFTTVRAPPAA
jgi:hypothetical protein